MPSLDFVYDLVEKLDEENLQYLVLTIREGRSEDKVDVFFNVEKSSEGVFGKSIEQIQSILESRDDEKPQKPQKPKRRRRKK
tara:strand:+ start:152 stop:397 length:246 start_codon:yes stop_codon:yes gene_type:complete